MKLKPLKQSDFNMKIIKDIGHSLSKKGKKYRYAIFECSLCKEEFKSQISSAKFKQQSTCIKCSQRKYFTKNKRIHTIWTNMKARCNNPNNTYYCNYGAKGIMVCEEWNSPEIFEEWATQNGYTDELTIDRKDSLKNYNPENCRWADRFTQSRNRHASSKKKSKFKGVQQNATKTKWIAQVRHLNKLYSLGTYDTEEEAAIAYDNKAITLSKDFLLNKEIYDLSEFQK